VSEYIRQQFLTGFIAGQNKVHTVHNGIDTVTYVPQIKTSSIVYVGRIIQEKGALPLAEAFTLIAPHYPCWHFVVCGVDRFEVVSDYERATHAYLSRLGEQCHYTGYIDHTAVMQQFCQAAIAVIPSVWQEPFGRTVLEAMTGGAAVVTSGYGGIAEVIGDAGQLVQPLTAQGLADAMEGLLKNDELLHDKQRQARARAVALFDIRSVAAQLDSLRQL
jgi:glycosyltransferase involved in cell wall biosynthesis